MIGVLQLVGSQNEYKIKQKLQATKFQQGSAYHQDN